MCELNEVCPKFDDYYCGPLEEKPPSYCPDRDKIFSIAKTSSVPLDLLVSCNIEKVANVLRGNIIIPDFKQWDVDYKQEQLEILAKKILKELSS